MQLSSPIATRIQVQVREAQSKVSFSVVGLEDELNHRSLPLPRATAESAPAVTHLQCPKFVHTPLAELDHRK